MRAPVERNMGSLILEFVASRARHKRIDSVAMYKGVLGFTRTLVLRPDIALH
jgi:hypothetical protein